MMSMKAEHLQSVNKLREKYIWYIFTRNDIYDKYYMIDGVEIPSKCIFYVMHQVGMLFHD